MDVVNKLFLGDSAKVLSQFPEDVVDLTVTSPPYDNIRNYKGKVTKESDFNGYSFPFEKIAQQLYRVTKPGGVVVWVVGDQCDENGSETGTSFRQALYFKECGFNIHDTMIYQKVGIAFPSSNRYYQEFEYMFVFSKGKPKTINLIKDRKNKWAGQTRWGANLQRRDTDELVDDGKDKKEMSEFGVRFNIWKIPNQRGYSTEDVWVHKEHPAIFPESIPKDHITSWTNPGDLVLDPFSGSGTTAKMAKISKRNYVGIELNEPYYNLSKKRLEEYGSNNLEELFG